MARKAPRLSRHEFDFTRKVEVGRGTTGKVLSVPWNDERVAVKVAFFRLPVSNDRDISEAEMLAKTSHRNIVNFFGVVPYKEQDCLVTELAPYGSVGDILYGEDRKVQISDKNRFKWTLDIAHGLAYIHFDLEPSICHGDLKSQNVLIFDSPRGLTAKISDFGKGRQLEATSSVHNFGSLLWSAPEVINMEAHSVLSDVWSFGATVVEMYTNQKPYAHISDRNKDLLVNVKEGQLTPLSQLSRTALLAIPSNIRSLLSRCFESNRRRRLSMRDAVSHLTDAQVTTKVAGSQTEDDFESSESLTAVESKLKTSPAVRKFHIWWWIGPRRHFNLDLPSEGAILGKDLRAAIVNTQQNVTGVLKLRQRRAKRKSDGALLVAAECLSFVDERGEAAHWQDTGPEELHEIGDKDEVPTAGGLRTLIVAENK